MFETKVLEKVKTHIVCSVTFFSPESRAVHEKMWRIYVYWRIHRSQDNTVHSLFILNN